MNRLVLVLVPAVLGLSCAGVQLPKEQLTDPGALLFNGYAKPEVNCWQCHNGDGRGARGPALQARVRKATDEELNRVILLGDGFMPKFREKLTDEEVAQLVAWLRTSFPATK